MADDLINLGGGYPTDAILAGQGVITPELLNTPLAPQTVQPDQNGRLLPEPSISEALQAVGMGLINGDLSGRGFAGGIGDAAAFYQGARARTRREAREQRDEQLQEYELIGRIRDRQLAEMTALQKASSVAKLKEEHPEFADLIDLNPAQAAKAIAAKGKGGSGGPFGGTGLDAQTMNIVIGGTKTGATDSVEYAAAYKKLAEPKVQVAADGSTSVVTPDMSAYAPPSGQFASPSAAMPPTADPAALPPGTDPAAIVDPTISVDPNAPKQTTQNIGGTSITTTQGVRQKWTGEQLARASFADRMANAENILAGLGDGADEAKTGKAGYAEAVLSAIPSLGLTDKIGGAIVKTAATPEQQQYLNAAQEWIRAKLRKESGAAIGDQEMIDEYSTYFPTPGDAPEVIKQKAQLRANNTVGMMKESGGAYQKLFANPLTATPPKTGEKPPTTKGMLEDDIEEAPAADDFSGLTEADIKKLAQENNQTVDEVKEALGIKK